MWWNPGVWNVAKERLASTLRDGRKRSEAICGCGDSDLRPRVEYRGPKFWGYTFWSVMGRLGKWAKIASTRANINNKTAEKSDNSRQYIRNGCRLRSASYPRITEERFQRVRMGSLELDNYEKKRPEGLYVSSSQRGTVFMLKPAWPRRNFGCGFLWGKFSAIIPKLFSGTPSALSSSTKLWRQNFKITYLSRDIHQKLFFNWPTFFDLQLVPHVYNTM